MKKIAFRKKRFTKKILVVILALVLVLVFLNLFQKEVRGSFYKISAPVQKLFWQIGDRVSDFFESIARTGKLKNEINELKDQNQNLISQIVELSQLKKENEALRGILEIGLEKEFKLMPTQIISKDIGLDMILIDKGEKDGAAKNMGLINQQGVIFGKVVWVYENFSKVMLISSKNTYFDGKIQEKDIPGLVKGEGSFKIMLDLIPRDKEIFEGDIVVSGGQDESFPKNFLVGKIKKIKKNDLEPLQQAEIEPFFNIEDANILFLISGR